jgi:REP element-mobilizing transposase RayT
MQRGTEGTKYCHLIWATRNGRSCFKIAEAARFCERAVHHACASMGWKADLIAVLPDRVHILVAVPGGEERASLSPRLQQVVTHLLQDGRVLDQDAGPVWASEGWCSVLSNAVSVSVVRRVLREKTASYGLSTPEAGAPP